ncbi:aldo/keto reductase [Pedobacter riviphilus]|uniref:Aldo/keto reductase n=1 Tax=Pedobacter riviphilus TaxID=2766984 RepID=A0ABX6TL49_9SPHI|nr:MULTISPECIES: aldo/keto reductase [Pedobacter]NII81809.1 D-threo-aldose 1-dehydrogenase [Pedobacter sp. SG908]NMN35811.1 D-threo-aldose 1-dehydrogenase [Pedobacter sp. SG918]QNR85645.1 aldo/keto reductase [Pedobacter riviphilus]
MVNDNKNQQPTQSLPPVIFGTSSLGNLYQAVDYSVKLEVVKACVASSKPVVFFDSAGKYGAGLALESLAKCLADLKVDPQQVVISNKLGWYRTPLLTPEPTFEAGIWKDIEHDAVQMISYDGILKCFEQGNKLLGNYQAQMVSVHDPDEYLSASDSQEDYKERYQQILDAYMALNELKSAGLVSSIGVGAKDWKIIQAITEDVELDWVMIANSLTIKSHPAELIAFIKKLNQKNIKVINSAIFNGGFLTGGDFYNYQPVEAGSLTGKALLDWRDKFFQICDQFNVLPAEACFSFSANFSGVKSIALNTTRPEKVAINAALAQKEIPAGFWQEMQAQGLIELLK